MKNKVYYSSYQLLRDKLSLPMLVRTLVKLLFKHDHTDSSLTKQTQFKVHVLAFSEALDCTTQSSADRVVMQVDLLT